MEQDRDTLLTFPCDYEFKAFGPNDGIFAEGARMAIDTIIPTPLDAVRVRSSAKSSYVCVSVLARLQNREQIEAIYAALRQVKNLKYLL